MEWNRAGRRSDGGQGAQEKTESVCDCDGDR